MLSKKEVEKVAKLARIELTAGEIVKMQKELSEVLDYFNLLKKAPVVEHSSLRGITPKAKIEGPAFGPKGYPAAARQRKDEAKPQEDEVVKKIIKAAPDAKGNYIKVKAIF